MNIQETNRDRNSVELRSHEFADPIKAKQITKRIPAEEGVWVFIFGDMMVFSLFFLVFTYYRSLDEVGFTQSQALLNPHYGALNTLLLLTSSWFVVLSLHCVRVNLPQQAARLIFLAIMCGGGFVLVKFFEYSEKISAGFVLTSNDFFMFYYILTGVHFLHLILGLLILTFLWRKAKSVIDPCGIDDADLKIFEGGAAYWHMVDLLWIVLFPLIYLMK